MKTAFHQPRDAQEYEQFAELIKQAAREGKLDEILHIFLTLEERNVLSLRVQIVRLLLSNNHSQREIQQLLNTSAATITRGSNQLKSVDPAVLDWINNKLNGSQA